MGILDDAIREHLDLKRRQGADQGELQRLEDEAFGPPSRPGDPDFPEGQQAAVAEAEGGDASAFHDQALDVTPEGADAGTGEQPAASAEAPATAEEPSAGLTEAPSEEAVALPGEPTVEHDTLGDEGDSEEVDLDIDLDIDEEIEDVGELDLDEGEASEPEADAGAPAGDEGVPEGGTATEEPIESLDTVEHHFEDALDEAEVVEDDEDGEDLSLSEDSDDEDVLEETPEFLRDAPEDDELWFEQGEPKDFDF